MYNKLKFQQLECYKLATDEQKEKLNKEQYFDLDKLPENQLQTEFVEYIYYRGTQVSILTIKRERHYFNSLCEFFQKSSHQENSLLDREKDFWIKQLKMWMIQNGRALTKHKVTNIQTESVEKAALIRYFESLLEFTLDRSETNELAKDIWHLERLPLILRTNPIVNHKTLNFRGIRQPDIREEVKKAIYHHLKTEALGSIKRELSAMNKFSKYLDEKHGRVKETEHTAETVIGSGQKPSAVTADRRAKQEPVSVSQSQTQKAEPASRAKGEVKKSVLQSLKDFQAKAKAQEQNKTTEKSKTHKKGEVEL